MGQRIHIVTESNSLEDRYLLSKLIWHWQRASHQISYGPLKKISNEIDLAICHFDQTHIAPECIPNNPYNKPFLNGSVLDISKKRYSSLRVKVDDLWTGPVIIKSNLNAFGEPEWQSRKPSYIERKRRKWAKRNWKLARTLPRGHYPVLHHISEVPNWVWNRSDLIVERFLPEKVNDLYCVRSYVFFGNEGYTYQMLSDQPVVKVGSMVSYKFIDQIPTELETFRKKFNLDFGKLDYVVMDGVTTVLDMNKTPTMGTDPDTPNLTRLANDLVSYTDNLK